MLNLSKKYGDERLGATCGYVLQRLSLPRCRHLKAILDSNLDAKRLRGCTSGGAAQRLAQQANEDDVRLRIGGKTSVEREEPDAVCQAPLLVSRDRRHDLRGARDRWGIDMRDGDAPVHGRVPPT